MIRTIAKEVSCVQAMKDETPVEMKCDSMNLRIILKGRSRRIIDAVCFRLRKAQNHTKLTDYLSKETIQNTIQEGVPQAGVGKGSREWDLSVACGSFLGIDCVYFLT